jgi:hypothetical protein
VFFKDVLVTLDTISTANWQSNPPNWGLDRIDQLLLFGQGKPLDNRYNFDQTGQGTVIIFQGLIIMLLVSAKY